MARPKNTDVRRDQIIDALVRVMSTAGYEKASVAAIAREAGLTTGLVHYHFGAKREVLLGLVERLVHQHEARLDDALDALSDPEDAAEALGAFIDCHLAIGPRADEAALACWVLVAGEALKNADVRTRFEVALMAQRSRLEDILRRGVDSGVFTPTVCTEVAAAALVTLVQGYFTVSRSAPAVIPPGSAAEAARAMAHGLMGGSW